MYVVVGDGVDFGYLEDFVDFGFVGDYFDEFWSEYVDYGFFDVF